LSQIGKANFEISSKEVEVRKSVVNKFLENTSGSGRLIAKSLNVLQRTVSDDLKPFEHS
jgi:hypothetical protein